MRVEGQATTGYEGAGTATRVDLPRAGDGIRAAHRPWCCDCKRTHDADQLDNDGRCAKCARAAVSRAKAAAAREARAAEITALEKAAQAEVKAKAREQHAVVRRPASDQVAKRATPARPAPDTKLPTEGNQGQPATRTSAPRATSTGSTSGKAPDAGTSTTEKKPSTREPAETAHRQAPVEAPSQPAPHAPQPGDTVQDLIRRAALVRDPLTRHLYDTAISALTALRLVLDQQHTPTASSAPTPALEAPTRPPGPVKGEAPARRTTPTRRRGSHGKPLDEAAVIRDYQNGDTPPVIAERYGVHPPRIRRLLDAHGIERRDDRSGHAGGQNRVAFTPDALAAMRRAYVVDGASLGYLATQLGVDERTVRRALVNAGVTIRPPAHQRHGTPSSPSTTTPTTEEHAS